MIQKPAHQHNLSDRFSPTRRRCCVVGMFYVAGILCSGFVSSLVMAEDASERVIATVNGQPLRADQMQLQFYLDQLPEDATPKMRKQLIDRLVDQELIRQFLKERKVTADPKKLEYQTRLMKELIATRGEQLEEVLKKLHLTPASVEKFLALPLAWEKYAHSVISPAQIQNEWKAHRVELDGTRVEAAQIVRVLSPEANPDQWQAAEKLLSKVRSQILSKELTFADAAKQYSQSPSGKRGGELGEFLFHGRVDDSISRVAFTTAPGEISSPFRTRFGVHLVKTESKIPGQLSLEDVREEIIDILAKRLWDEVVHQQREKASIRILDQSQP